MMTILLWAFLYLLFVHWWADFVLQTLWQQTNKSKDNSALSEHVITYSAALFVASYPIFGLDIAWVWFVVTNCLLHYWTDYFTSRWTARLYAKQDWHNFFAVVGLDQLIHQTTLALTLYYFLLKFE